jgi:small subunit ribosomal protein S8
MLTRIRNAHAAELELVEMPHSGMKGEIARILKREGYIGDFVIEGGKKRVLRLYLKYTPDREPVITGLKRISTPGRRTYASADKPPSVLAGLGIAIISTSSGIMTDKEARKRRLGGEVLCSVW